MIYKDPHEWYKTLKLHFLDPKLTDHVFIITRIEVWNMVNFIIHYSSSKDVLRLALFSGAVPVDAMPRPKQEVENM